MTVLKMMGGGFPFNEGSRVAFTVFMVDVKEDGKVTIPKNKYSKALNRFLKDKLLVTDKNKRPFFTDLLS